MTNILSTELAELICTRISHDLAGNIGTVSNALEMLEDDEDDIADVKSLLENSAKTLAARIKFFRVAFGLKNAAPKNTTELNTIICNYLETVSNAKTPIIIKSDIKNVSCYKIVMLAVMALADVFIRGGTISVFETDEMLRFEAVSDFDLSAQKLENMQQALTSHTPSDNPSLFAHILYLKAFLGEIGVDIDLSYDAKSAVLHLK